jgi:TonB family protein
MTTLVDPDTGGPQVETSGEEHVPPIPEAKSRMPAFPEEALTAGAEGYVVVRILIDTEGQVAEVTDSPKESSSTGPHAAAFRAAVDEAVRRWRFQPGRIDSMRPGKDLDGDGKPDYTVVDHFAFTPYVYDLRFDFRIAQGAPAVDSTKLGAGPAP